MLPSVPFRPRFRREHLAQGSPEPPSPLDSGYASASPVQRIPEHPDKENEQPLAEFRSHYDGNQSESDDTYSNSDQESYLTNVEPGSSESPSRFRTTGHLRRRLTTLPQPTLRSRSSLPASYYSLPSVRPQQRGSKKVSLRHLDRYIPASGATEDPFIYRPRVVTPIGSQSRSRARAETAASRNEVGNVLGPLDQNSIDGNDTQLDTSTAWTLGLGGTAVNNGQGQLVRSGTNARLFRTTFPTAKLKSEEETEKYKTRLAAALGLDRAQRILDVNLTTHRGLNSSKPGYVPTQWNGTEWVNDGPTPKPQKQLRNRMLPTAPFNLSFSSSEGCKAILAFGRSDKTLGLLSLYDDPDPAASRSAPRPRFEVVQPSGVACLSWKPVCTVRPSRNRASLGVPVKNEDLLVGDEAGMIYYYAVEWPERWEVERHNWPGDMTLLARIAVHTQQICGLAWSKNGDVFASGGNDNTCYLFDTVKAMENYAAHWSRSKEDRARLSTVTHDHGLSEISEAETEIQMSQIVPYHPAIHLGPGDARHRWNHGAAVKAIAFCPWQDSLVATGGGSNDKCVHFFHTGSGAALASISVSAQVTSLIWSTTRREIAATFGYAQPDHPVRIAVFSWPECHQIAAIPWAGEHRALYAIPYPCGPDDMTPSGVDGRRGGRAAARRHSRSRTAKEGCIIVASSDKSVKFHEVWAADKRGTASVAGILGGSPILEFLEGVDREGMVIR
ncbi:hypothetical protein VTI28DRAFT_5210 [Corynascus sepedonium]